MDQGKQSQKQELVSRLEGYRGSLKLPDARQVLSQSKNLLNLAGKLPSTMQAQPARTLIATAGITCLIVLLLKPKRRKKQIPSNPESKTVPRQLVAFSLAVTQPLVRVWLTERARKWLQK